MSISASEYLRRVKKVKSKTALQRIANEVILKDEATLKILKEQDFLEGDIYGDGTLIGYRSLAYQSFKASLNPKAGGAVDLILTGAFVEAMFLLKPQDGRYRFGNSNYKAGLLTTRYGKGIFGLNQIVFEKFQKEVLAPRFRLLLKQTAGIG